MEAGCWGLGIGYWIRDCEYADQLVQSIIDALILAQISYPDLSLGNLSNLEVEGLFASETIRIVYLLDLQLSLYAAFRR